MDKIYSFAISALSVSGTRLLQPQYTLELSKELFDSYKRMVDVQQVRILKGNFKMAEFLNHVKGAYSVYCQNISNEGLKIWEIVVNASGLSVEYVQSELFTYMANVRNETPPTPAKLIDAINIEVWAGIDKERAEKLDEFGSLDFK